MIYHSVMVEAERRHEHLPDLDLDPELGDEAVDLVEHEVGEEALDEGLAQRGVRLDVHPLDGVDEELKQMAVLAPPGRTRSQKQTETAFPEEVWSWNSEGESGRKALLHECSL
ncbi:unnamed protein product [Urochloa humidicola]